MAEALYKQAGARSVASRLYAAERPAQQAPRGPQPRALQPELPQQEQQTQQLPHSPQGHSQQVELRRPAQTRQQGQALLQRQERASPLLLELRPSLEPALPVPQPLLVEQPRLARLRQVASPRLRQQAVQQLPPAEPLSFRLRYQRGSSSRAVQPQGPLAASHGSLESTTQEAERLALADAAAGQCGAAQIVRQLKQA